MADGRSYPERQSEPSKPKPKTNGTSIVNCTDPEGYEIKLSVDTWENHICLRHPEMAARLDKVRATIVEPDLIQARSGGNTYFYYRLTGEKFFKDEDLYILVVIARNDVGRSGRVKTAHLLKKLKPSGDKTVWIPKKIK